MDVDQRSDEELARQAGDGDEAAFAELYRRHFSGVYDLAIRLSRDRDVAALVVQSSFLRVYQGLRAGALQAPFRLHLFAAACGDVRERLRRRRGPVSEGEEGFAVAGPARLADPALAAQLPELARIAWQVARETRPEEYELLHLSARQQLDEGEIAAIFRTRPEAVRQRLARLRADFEESFSALLLLRLGRRECLDLDFLVGDDEWSTALRRRIARHLASCQTCQATCRRYPGGLELFATLTPAPAPASWQETMLSRLQNAVRTGAVAAEPAAVAPTVTTVTPPPRRPADAWPGPTGAGAGIGDWFGRVFGGGGARGPLLAVLGGGLLIVAVTLAALCGAGAFEGGEEKATPSPTISVTATTTKTRTPTKTPTPTETATSPPLATPTGTPLPATDTPTPLPATDTPTPRPQPPTATPQPPTATPVPPTETSPPEPLP